MQNIAKYMGLLVAFAALTSCNDLDKIPLDQLSDGSYWKSNEDATKAVNDLYTCYPEWDGNGIIGLVDEAPISS